MDGRRGLDWPYLHAALVGPICHGVLQMIYHGDATAVLRGLHDESVQCCVTSPPYWGLRDYGVDGQLGLEKTPDEYVAKLVAVFQEVRRILKKDGTLWLNLGDSYAGSNKGVMGDGSVVGGAKQRTNNGSMLGAIQKTPVIPGLKPKDLVGIPWMVAFALRADGWYLRSDIIWAKPNPMPESVKDRPTKSHEYLFLLSRSEKYYYDSEAIKEVGAGRIDVGNAPEGRLTTGGFKYLRNGRPKTDKQRGHSRRHDGFNDRWDQMTKEEQCSMGRNKRSVWTVATRPYPEAHFATFPPKLIEPCILAGSRIGDTILDPFAGSGTTLAVAQAFNRKAVGIELNVDYLPMINNRLRQEVLPFSS